MATVSFDQCGTLVNVRLKKGVAAVLKVVSLSGHLAVSVIFKSAYGEREYPIAGPAYKWTTYRDPSRKLYESYIEQVGGVDIVHFGGSIYFLQKFRGVSYGTRYDRADVQKYLDICVDESAYQVVVDKYGDFTQIPIDEDAG